MELGSLERELMELVWKHGTASVRDIHGHLQGRLAYTTIMTTMDRLYKKGAVQRELRGKAYFYSEKISEAQVAKNAFRKVLSRITENYRQQTTPVLACLLDAVSEHDLVTLEELERLVKARRKKAKDE